MDRWEKENIYRYLNQIIDRELDKPEPDMELVDECNALLDDIDQGKYDPNPDVKSRQLQELYLEYHKKHNRNKVIQFRSKWTKLVPAACVILMLVGVPITVAAVNGISPRDLIAQLGNKILSWNVGETVEFEGISLIRNGESIKYDSIEDCVKKENLDIYYTSWLPDGVYIDSVVAMTTEDYEELIVIYSDESITFSVVEGSSVNYKDGNQITDNQIVIHDSIAYYRTFNDMYMAEIVLENKVYTISAPNYEDMLGILNGLKKVYE